MNIIKTLLTYLLLGACYVEMIGDMYPYDKSSYIGMMIYIILSGLVIDRIGSIVIEPILKLFLPKQDYNKYLKAIDIDSVIPSMVNSLNLYRMIISLCCVITLSIFIYDGYIHFSQLVILALIVSIKAYVKQTNYISKRIAFACKAKED